MSFHRSRPELWRKERHPPGTEGKVTNMKKNKNVSDIPEWISNILEENGMSYSIYDSDDRSYVELEFSSDNGEDVVFTIDYATDDVLSFVREFRDYANEYDPDEHVEMWIPYRGKNGVPKSIRTLLNDADSIGDVLMKTAEELSLAERKHS